MLKRRWTRIKLSHTAAVVALCLGLAGQAMAQQSAARDVFKGSRELRERTVKTASAIERYAKQLERTDKALRGLVGEARNLSDRYKRFSRELKELEKTLEAVGQEVTKLRSIGTNYLTAWDKSNLTIADPALREASGRRLAELNRNYDSVSDRISAIAVELPPLTGQMRDLNVFLGADLTVENARLAYPAIERCGQTSARLTVDINDLVRRLQKLMADAPRS